MHGPQLLCDLLETITPGLVSMIVLNVWSVNREQCAGLDGIEVKQLVVGSTRLLLESTTVLQKQDLWSSLLKTIFVMANKNAGSSSTTELPHVDFEGTALEAMEFDSTYSKLAYATLPTIDGCADVSDGTIFFGSKLAAFLQTPDGGKYASLIPQALEPTEVVALETLLKRSSAV